MKKILLIIMVFLLSGCYDYNELTDLAIVSSMIIDYKDNKYVVDIEVLETKQNAPKTSFFLEAKGNSFEEALTNIYAKTPKHIYFNHIFAVILSKSIAEDKLEKIYDYFTIDNDVRKDSVFVLSDDIDKLLQFETEDKLSIGETIKEVYKYSEKENGNFRTANFREILNCYLNKKNYLLSSIKIDKNVLALSDVYLISDNKLTIKLDSKYVLFANLIDNLVNCFTISLNNDTFEIYDYKMKINILHDEIGFILNADARLFGNSNSSNGNKDAVIKIESDISYYLKNYIKDALKYSIDIQKDVYNIDYRYYQHFKNDYYEDIFNDLKYKIEIKTTFNEKGLLLNQIGDGEVVR